MGGKYGRKRQHFLFYLAGVFCILSLPACSHLTGIFQENSHVEKANGFIRKGDFTSAITENEMALSVPLLTQPDLTLFQKGLIQGHPENPEKDLKKARDQFKGLMDLYPESTLSIAAEMLIHSFEEIESLENETDILPCAFDEIESLGDKIENKEYSAALYREKIRRQYRQINALNKEIDELRQQLENLKTIDIHLDQKKKKEITKR
jgi:hypothetical protein